MDSSKKFDNPNPQNSANIISKLLFWWTVPLFKLGYKNDLDTKDLYNTLQGDFSEPLGNILETNWNKELAAAKKNGRKPKLLKAISRTFLMPYSVYGVLLCVHACVIKVAQPLILGKFIQYFDRTSNVTSGDAYGYACGVVILSAIGIVIMHQCGFGQMRIGMRCRIACCSLIYRKLLRLNRTSLGQTTAGQVVNLLSNDVSRFDMAPMFLHYIWIMPLQAAVCAYFMYNSVGVSALAGLLVITLQAVPLQGYLSRWTARMRMKIARRTDERVRLMSEIISGIQVIKMYAWEQPFEKLAQLARKMEIDILTVTSYVRGFSIALMVFTERTVLYVTLVTYVLLGNRLSGDKVFSMAQYFNSIQLYMAIFYPMAIVTFGEAKVSVKRLEAFLLQDENPKTIHQSLITDNKQHGEIMVKKIRASWTLNSITDTLNNFSVTITPGSLCAIVGPVGAGKSSFLQLLLGELVPHSGSVNVNGAVSYASQEPWLFVSSVRNNILFGQPYDRDRYKRVVHVCALERDLEQLPYGDKTLVGERGVSLSGGQRARINLARAVYRRADVYLLDDPLSAVDTHVGKHLFDACVTQYLANKTRVLITHQVQFLRNADIIILINNGQIEKMGTYTELSNDLAHVGPPDNNPVEPSEPGIVWKRLISLQSNASTNADEDEEPAETQELMEKGSMSGSVYLQYLRAGGSVSFLLFLLLSLLVAQLASSGADYWVTYWTNQEETRHYADTILSRAYANETLQTNPYNFTDTTEDYLSTTVTDIIDNMAPGNVSTTLSDSLLLEPENVTNSTFDQIEELLQNVTQTKNTLFTTDTCIYIYTVCILGSILLTTLRSLVFFKVCMNASIGLHRRMFNNILQATMRFFDTNPSGRILNRFSKDMGAIDELLPRAMVEAVQIFLVMSGIITMVVLVNPWMILPALVMGLVFYVVRVVYLATAQDIKRLEGITRSPVFSHVSASLDGLTTIRASGAQFLLQKEFDTHQDLHTRSWFLIIGTQSAFGFCLDLISVLFLAIVTFSFMLTDTDTTASGNVGLAITQALILTGMLQHGMKQTAEVVNQMTSVERVLQYTQLEKEGPFESDLGKKPPKEWPSQGLLEFKQVYLRHSPTDMPVLKNLSFRIKPGQKVGIVGRTGAGKSSLISALFRLAPTEGTICIDGIDTKTVGLNDLRTRISIIPQEPVLFSATLRHNLDPFSGKDDSALWTALDEVELKDLVESLDHGVNEGGSNFSAGQRQLVCLARAIIRNNKVLVLDEATANVDPQTDALIQTAIRNKFADCTVLTIAHRLNTVMDSDKVIVMDGGQVVEFGHPHILLQEPDGYFTKMLQQMGKHMEQNLKQIAQEAYDRSPRDLDDLNLELIDK
ncbi:uncharacterized protein CBL_06782 [Carabus blaptoides fortunei]